MRAIYRKRGRFEKPTHPSLPNRIFAFLIRRTSNAFWVAEEQGRIVGYSDSFVRGSFWYFSWLLISLSHQGRDIGARLLEKTLGSWKDVRITNKATMTFAFNPASQALYTRHGMYSPEPVYVVAASAQAIGNSKGPDGGLDLEESKSLNDASPTVAPIDERVLGFALDWHHEFFFATRGRCYIFKDSGEPVGYVYVRPSRAAGPTAVSSERCMEPVLRRSRELSANQGVDRVSYWTPGSNVHAVDFALKRTMRFEPLVFMCTRPFA